MSCPFISWVMNGRNAAKVDGRTLELANAPELGEDSVAEETEVRFEEGRSGILFSARRPPASLIRQTPATRSAPTLRLTPRCASA